MKKFYFLLLCNSLRSKSYSYRAILANAKRESQEDNSFKEILYLFYEWKKQIKREDPELFWEDHK